MTDRVINMSFFRLYASVVGFIFSMAVFAGEEPESDPLPVPVPVIKPKPVVIEAAPRDVFKEEPPVAPPVIEETPVDLTPPDYYQRETKIYPRNRIEEIADILKKIFASRICINCTIKFALNSTLFGHSLKLPRSS
jgi:hypothetical protein